MNPELDCRGPGDRRHCDLALCVQGVLMELAPTYTDEQWRNFGTQRKVLTCCTRCDKVVFTEAKAKECAEQISHRARKQMSAYLGPCGHWHLTRVRKRK